MQKIALTGNIGSGKTIISEIFSKLGIPAYNADENARRILFSEQVVPVLMNTFGKEIMDESGLPDRTKIADIVFNNPLLLHQLNRIIHPLVMKDFLKWCDVQSNVPFVILESAIIFENGLEKFMDKVILVTAPEELRISRVMIRDGVDRQKVLDRIKNQMPEEQKASKADFIIKNDEKAFVMPRILEVYNQLI